MLLKTRLGQAERPDGGEVEVGVPGAGHHPAVPSDGRKHKRGHECDADQQRIARVWMNAQNNNRQNENNKTTLKSIENFKTIFYALKILLDLIKCIENLKTIFYALKIF